MKPLNEKTCVIECKITYLCGLMAKILKISKKLAQGTILTSLKKKIVFFFNLSSQKDFFFISQQTKIQFFKSYGTKKSWIGIINYPRNIYFL